MLTVYHYNKIFILKHYFLFAKSMLVIIPRIKAHATVVNVIAPIEKVNPPIPIIRIIEAVKRFLLSFKSTGCNIFRPDTAIKPYRVIHTAPMTQEGIDEITAVIGPINEIIMHSIAATKMVNVDAFLVIATQAIDSP